MDDLSGQSIGRYQIIEPLGEGGMAVVYRGYDTRLECDVAIKFIRTEGIEGEELEEMRKRFGREARKVAQLTHPNIVSVTDYGEYEGIPYLVMAYFHGGTLKEKIAKGKIGYREAARLLLPVGQALAFAYGKGIEHLDIKPSNILITQSGEVMLTDFGVARIMSSRDGQAGGVGTGTPAYMAPEQIRGTKVDGRADIYALGVVFYELITGRTPFRGETPAGVVMKSVEDPLPRPAEFEKGTPKRVEEVLWKSLAREPEDRYQSMAEFVKALEGIGGVEEGGKRGKSSGKWVAAGLVGIGLIAAAGMIMSGRGIPAIGLLQQATATATVTPTATTIPTKTLQPTPTEKPTATMMPTPTPMGGGSGKIAYVMGEGDNAEIYVMNVDGSHQTRLTQNNKRDFGPVWSPDGKKIAFSTEYFGNYKIYVMNADGSDLKCLTSEYGSEMGPVWSPDGGKILYTDGLGGFVDWKAVKNDQLEVYVMNTEGGEKINLTHNTSSDYDPVWSPDGSKIAFVSDRYGSADVYMMNADGSEQVNVTKTGGDEINPSFSPDGKKIAYISAIGVNYAIGITVMNTDGSGLYKITSSENYWGSDWSPDQSRILTTGYETVLPYYLVVSGGGIAKMPKPWGPIWKMNEINLSYVIPNNIYSIDVITGEEKNLSIDTNGEYSPLWSPDNKEILLISWVGEGYGVMVMSPGGSDQKY